MRETRLFASEVKFVLDPVLTREIRVWARRSLRPDPHGGGEACDRYRVTSIYCDTDALDVFHRVGS